MARAWSWVLCFMVSVESVVGYQFTVGGSKGWGLPSPSDYETYNQWAGRNRFQIGDTLLFKYDNTVDSVAQVRRESYNNCNTTAPIASYTTGNTSFKFPINGAFYFISGNESRCQLEEKLIVLVLAPCHMGKGKNCKRAPAPSLTSPPLSPIPMGSSPSPSPSLASPAPSPTPTASSPSPSPLSSSPSPALASPTSMGSSPSPSPSLASPASSPSPSPMASPASSPSLSPSPSLGTPASSPSLPIGPTSSPSLSPSPSLSSPASPPSPQVSPTTDSSPTPPSPAPSAASTTLPLPSLLIPLLFATLINSRMVTI